MPPESAPGAPGAEDESLLRPFDKDAYYDRTHACYGAKGVPGEHEFNAARGSAAAAPGGLNERQSKELAAQRAVKGDWLSQEWMAGYPERFDNVWQGQDHVSSSADDSKWEDEWWPAASGDQGLATWQPCGSPVAKGAAQRSPTSRSTPTLGSQLAKRPALG